MKKLPVLVSLVTLMILSSCYTVYITGRNFNDTRVSELARGKTTEPEVIAMFGEPFSRGSINHDKVYIYSYEENEFPEDGGNEVYIKKNYKSLMIVFDENQVVKHFSHNVPVVPGTMEMMIIHREKIEQEEEEEE